MAGPSRSATRPAMAVQRTGAWTALWLAILTSAVTAIGIMTTAYFGIRTMANPTQRLVGKPAKH